MISEKDLNAFKAREIKAKTIFTIREIDKNSCYEFVRRYHYLANAKFFCMYGYGLFYRDECGGQELVGVATFTAPQGTYALKGWFGLPNDCNYVLELSRLCMLPCLNNTNATSFLLGNSMKMMGKAHGIKAVITLADSSRHVGSIYQVCNFKYYGKTDKKMNFWSSDGIKNPRGKSHDRHGVWIEKPYKHRYAYLLDKSLKVLYDEQPIPKADERYVPECCHGTKKVFDNRFKEWYSCPVCCGYIKLLKEGEDTPAIEIKNTTKYDNHGQLELFDF